MNSDSIKNQLDYKLIMSLINKVLSSPDKFGSVIFGKKYANFYNEEINNKMLINEFIDMEILQELKLKVDNDLQTVRADCNRRACLPINKEYLDNNNHMMSAILDFIKSIN